MASEKKKDTDTGGVRDMTEVAREIERTSNSSRFSTHERIVTPDGGELILEHRGEPDKDTPPGDA